MNKEARIASAADTLRRAQDARVLAASPIWGDAWDALEQTLLDRLLQCGPTDDDKRYRLQTAITVARDVRRVIEVKPATAEQLEKELEYLEGVKPRPIA